MYNIFLFKSRRLIGHLVLFLQVLVCYDTCKLRLMASFLKLLPSNRVRNAQTCCDNINKVRGKLIKKYISYLECQFMRNVFFLTQSSATALALRLIFSNTYCIQIIGQHRDSNVYNGLFYQF